MKQNLLQIKDLSAIYKTETGSVLALSRVCLNVARGQSFGLVGESGCGKSTLLKTIIKVIPGNAEITGGEVWFDGMDLLSLQENEIRKIRWQRISMITQSAMNALDPVYKIGDQIYETLKVHQDISRKAFLERLDKMFSLVGVSTKRYGEFPHQFSGGMRQRAIIAMSLILEPDLVIADEPTTSLDVIVQDQIFQNIRELQKLLGFSMLLVTHDIALVVENCDRIGVMYGGQMMEIGNTRQVIKECLHPYTMGLKHSFPNINELNADLISIPGSPPELKGSLKGCRFAQRCPFRLQICFDQEPLLCEVTPDHWAACHRRQEAQELRSLSARADIWLNGINQQQ